MAYKPNTKDFIKEYFLSYKGTATLEQFREACLTQFEFVGKHMKNGVFKSIRLKYLGTLVPLPAGIGKVKKALERMKNVIDEEEYLKKKKNVMQIEEGLKKIWVNDRVTITARVGEPKEVFFYYEEMPYTITKLTSSCNCSKPVLEEDQKRVKVVITLKPSSTQKDHYKTSRVTVRYAPGQREPDVLLINARVFIK